MALQKQLVHLNFTNGLQRKDDEKLVIPTKLTVADNVEFDDKNSIIRRGGQSSFGSGGSTAAVRMYDHEDGVHLELEDGLHVKRLSASTDYYFSASTPTRNVRAGALTSRIQGTNVNPKDVFSTNVSRRAMDVAEGSTTYCLVWEDNDPSSANIRCKYSIRDYNDNELYAGSLGDAANYNTKPRVMWDSTNSRYVILYSTWTAATTDYPIKATAITQAGVVSVAATTIMTVTGANTVASSATRDILFDASLYTGVGFVVAARSTDSNLFVRLVDLSLAGIVATTSAAIGVNYALTTSVTYSGGVLTGHVFYDDTTNLVGRRLPSDTGTLSAAVTIAGTTFSGADSFWRTAVEFNGTNFIIVADVYYSDSTGGKYVLGQQVMTVSTSHVLSTQSEVATRCPLAGRIFTMKNRYYIPLLFDSLEFQRVLLTLDLSTVLTERTAGLTSSTPSFVARTAAGEVASYSLAISTSSEGSFLTLRPQQRVATTYSNFIPFWKYDGNTRVAGLIDRTPAAINRLQLTYNDQLGDNNINGLTYLAGALPLIVDGQTIAEEGFHWAPEVPIDGDLTAVTTGTGFYDFPSVGTYNVAFTYAWEDSKGNWHESGIAKVYEVTTTGGNLGLDGGVVTPPTQKANAQLLMYRTLVSSTDTTLYLAHIVPLGAGVTISEADLVNGEVLYTEGGVLANTPMPSCRQLCTFQKRLVASGCDDGTKIHWSKQTSPGFPAEFATTDINYQATAPAAAGRVVGSVEIDDKLVVVCESAVGVIYGQGPSATGTQGQYSDFTTAVSEVGALWGSPKSILKEEAGVWFHSAVGLRLFARGGGVARGQDGKHVGSDVDDLLSPEVSVVAVSGVTTSSSSRTKQQVRFYLGGNSSAALVWDTHWRQWTRFTGCQNLDARFVDGVYYHLSNVSTTPLLRYFSDTVYTDVNDSGTATQAFTSTVTTGWLSFAGIQGFQRIYRLMLTGVNTTASAQTIAGTFTYDFSTTMGDSFTTNQTPNAASSVQIQHHMAKQKCEAMKISITFQPQTTSNTGRLRLTDLTLQVGIKPGYFKLPSASRV